jgi:hypothetical protein
MNRIWIGLGFAVLAFALAPLVRAQDKPLQPGVFNLPKLFKKGLETKGPENRGAYTLSVLGQNAHLGHHERQSAPSPRRHALHLHPRATLQDQARGQEPRDRSWRFGNCSTDGLASV